MGQSPMALAVRADPLTFVVVALALTLAAVIVISIRVRRPSRVDATLALRYSDRALTCAARVAFASIEGQGIRSAAGMLSIVRQRCLSLSTDGAS